MPTMAHRLSVDLYLDLHSLVLVFFHTSSLPILTPIVKLISPQICYTLRICTYLTHSIMPQFSLEITYHNDLNNSHQDHKPPKSSNQQKRQMPRVEHQYGQRAMGLEDFTRKPKASGTQRAHATRRTPTSNEEGQLSGGAWWTWPPSFLTKGRSKKGQNGRPQPSHGRRVHPTHHALPMRTEQRPNLWEEVRDIFRDPFNMNQKEAAARQRARVPHARANASALANPIPRANSQRRRSRLTEGDKAELSARDREGNPNIPIARPAIVRKPVPVHSKAVPRHTVQIIHPSKVRRSIHENLDAIICNLGSPTDIRRKGDGAGVARRGTQMRAEKLETEPRKVAIDDDDSRRQTTMSRFIRHSPLPSASALHYAPPDIDMASQPCDVCGRTGEPGFVWTSTKLWLCEPCRENASPIELPPQTNRKPMPQPMGRSLLPSPPVSPISRSSVMSSGSVLSEETASHWFDDEVKPEEEAKPQSKWDDTTGHWQQHIPGLSPYTFHAVGTHLPFAGEEEPQSNTALPLRTLKNVASSIYPEDLMVGDHDFPMPPMPAHVGISSLAHDASNSIRVSYLRADAQARRKKSASKETLSRDRQSSFYGFWDPILKEKLRE